MLECLILGDSIATGIHMFRKECTAYARVGINTSNFIKKYAVQSLSAETVIISLGTNDSDGMNTYRNLQKLRKKVKAKKVYWVLPVQFTKQRDFVEMVAAENNDILIRIPYVSQDKVHPSMAGYQRIGELAR
jgi:lysophospholipase L1-like esterase